MIAVQGPRALEIVRPLVERRCRAAAILSRQPRPRSPARRGIVSRTGYTGEDGCELIVPADDRARSVGKADRRGRAVRRHGGRTGRRDTLRLEAGMPLYGHELNEADQSVSGRAGLRRRISKAARSPAATRWRSCERRRPLPRARRAGCSTASACRAKVTPMLSRRRARRPGHQRHVFAHARAADRDGLRPTRVWPRPGTEVAIDIRGQSRAGRSRATCRFIADTS